MLLSVLLPTRERLDYLKLAIETVVRQDFPDWELVVSDNDSREDIAGHVTSLDDPRVRYFRTDRFVSVTENWNTALAHSRGDYVVMLGDDDGLLQGYVSRMRDLVERFDQPDVVYTTALLYTYPGVQSEQPEGSLAPNGYAEFFPGPGRPFVLEHDVALRVVRSAMNFKLAHDYNMQYSLISRRLIDELRPYGAFFQSRFPDYYATNVAFLKARRIVVDPEPAVIIGVTPKSYGYYHANRREDEGRAFLAGASGDQVHKSSREALLPGSNINIGWLSAMQAIREHFGDELGLRVGYRRFRRLQAAHVYMAHARGAATDEQLRALQRRLSLRERLIYGTGFTLIAKLQRVAPTRLRDKLGTFVDASLRQFPSSWKPPRMSGRYANLLEVFEHESARGLQPSQAPTTRSR